MRGNRFLVKLREYSVAATLAGAILLTLSGMFTVYHFGLLGEQEIPAVLPQATASNIAQPDPTQTYDRKITVVTVRILPAGTFDPSIKSGDVQAEPNDPNLLPAIAPLPRPKPKMWERNYAVWVLDSDQGDDADVIKLRREWRSCDVLNRPPICNRPASTRRDAEPLKGY